MKKIILIVFLGLFYYSCVSTEQIEEQPTIEKYYFYFDKTHPKMKIYGKKSELRHVYDIEGYDPIIFIPRDSIEKEINITSLKKYYLKDYNWLNNLTPSEADYFFFRDKIKKDYYLIEKRESNKVLYLRRVYFIQEICD